MAVKPPAGHDEVLTAAIERLRQSGVLGDGRLRRLFDYLANRSLTGDSPKEIEIAVDVFDKNADFDVSQDALVRVYVHKLRRALAAYYESKAGSDAMPLQVARGAYRLVNEVAPDAGAKPSGDGEQLAARPNALRPRYRLTIAGIALASAALGCAAGALLFRTAPGPSDAARNVAVWQELVSDGRPLLLVVGDYYLFGQSDESMEIRRLIREFSVNSKSDLDAFRAAHPQSADQYVDLGLRYLPTSTAFALRQVIPLIDPEPSDRSGGRRRFDLILASELTPEHIKNADIVYVGYLSALGSLRPLVFSGSRFAVGDSFDELRDNKTSQRYVSQTESQSVLPTSATGGPSYKDFGLFASFRGPGGNIIVIIAGTRDEGVRQTAELFTDPARLNSPAQRHLNKPPFEALVEVSAIDGVNMNGKIVVESAR